MFTAIPLRVLPLVLAALAASPALRAADGDDPCTHFKWDVTRERAVMAQAPTTVTAAKAGGGAPSLQLEKDYTLALAPQDAVTFVAKPGKPTLTDGAHAGIARFHVAEAGHYRIAMTSAHWLDVLQGTTAIKSLDFNGAHGCARPRKVVEFEFPANSDLVLQLSGAADASVDLAIVRVVGATAKPKS
jgi:hypothetical protein